MSAVLTWLAQANLPVWATVVVGVVGLLLWRGPALLGALDDSLDRRARRRVEHTAIHAKDKRTREAAREVLALDTRSQLPKPPEDPG